MLIILSLRYFDRNPVGRLMTRVTNDVEALNEAFSSGIVTVFGDVSQTRSLCYVSDLIEGIFRLMMSEVVDPVLMGCPKRYSERSFMAR